MTFIAQVSYNASTGVLSFGDYTGLFNNYEWRGYGWMTCDVYLKKKEVL